MKHTMIVKAKCLNP